MTKWKLKENVARIYGLVDPRDGRVRYVGKTKKELEARLAEHRNFDTKSDAKTAWVVGLRKLGLAPTIVLLDSMRTCERNSDDEEEFWVRVYRAEGHSLLNTREGGSRGRIVRRFPPEEIAALRIGKMLN